MSVFFTGGKSTVVPDAGRHRQLFWKVTFRAREFSVRFAPEFPEGLEITTFFTLFLIYSLDQKCLQTMLKPSSPANGSDEQLQKFKKLGPVGRS